MNLEPGCYNNYIDGMELTLEEEMEQGWNIYDCIEIWRSSGTVSLCSIMS